MANSERAPPFERILTQQEKQQLRGSVLRNRELLGVDLSDADLRGATIENVVFHRCSLAGADLRGARLVLCDFRFVVLAGACLDDARFDGTTFVEVAGLTSSDRRAIEERGGTFQQVRASLR